MKILNHGSFMGAGFSSVVKSVNSAEKSRRRGVENKRERYSRERVPVTKLGRIMW
jgi:hypothetical protein